MDEERIIEAIVNASQIAKNNAPRRSGKLREVGVDYTGSAYQRGEISIKLNESLVPYAKYTEMPWSATSPLIWRSIKHPEWNGKHHSFLYNHVGWEPTTPKTNPNEGWFKKAWGEIAETISIDLDADLTFTGD